MTTDPTPESARALLDRHGLPEDVIDGVLCLHAQELAALQRLRMDELDLTGQKARFVGRIVDLIDPTRTAAVPVAAPPTTEQTALRDCIRRALCEAAGFGFAWGTDMLEPDEYGEVADAVLAVLPAPADRAAGLREAADALGRMDYDTDSHDYGYDTYRDAWNGGVMDGADLLRRLAVEAGQAEAYGRAIQAPPSAETCAALRERLESGEVTRRKVRSRVAAEAPHTETRDDVVARVLYVAEVIEANGIGWAADSVRRACRGDAEQPRTCAHCGQVHAASSLTHFGAPGGPWYCVDRDDCRGAGGLPPRKPVAAPAVVAQPGKETAAGDPPVVAYRSDGGRLLNCLRHVPPPAARHADFHPVTSEDLPDGGICTYPDCGADVLITTEQPQ
ncbi:hypothetical protein PV355_01670 [Streptomyces stelliscabiei]|uniref:hypothetical protein n=1 Tax=Streptomyces stelliscabiei TaxID=146820 RepID=UPI0029ADBCCD|nr:hypothetical protein [Streptomyces stelliscabiei]MDX2513875.1 hypothetical protein [Streptomyces stelliscabiei]